MRLLRRASEQKPAEESRANGTRDQRFDAIVLSLMLEIRRKCGYAFELRHDAHPTRTEGTLCIIPRPKCVVTAEDLKIKPPSGERRMEFGVSFVVNATLLEYSHTPGAEPLITLMRGSLPERYSENGRNGDHDHRMEAEVIGAISDVSEMSGTRIRVEVKHII